jgi:D-serine deaminase-like pyridoxal phosphate-dependent protein
MPDAAPTPDALPALIDDLPTPCVLVERDRLAANIERMQRKADTHGVRLRPHAKTHKSLAIARRQQAAGAHGLTVATVAEAEAFVRAGFDDVCIAYPLVGAHRLRRVRRLMETARLSFCLDTPEAVDAASAFFVEHGAGPRGAGPAGNAARVLMEVDVGHGRCGVRHDAPAAADLARHIAAARSLRLSGVLTHAGQAYHGPRHDDESPEGALRRVAEEERTRMLALAVRLREAGVPGAVPNADGNASDASGGGEPFVISIGSTPSMRFFENAAYEGFRVTEVRPGNYVFYDAMQVALGTATLEDCALTVLATVVSRRRARAGTHRLFLDAGKKVVTADTGALTEGYGLPLYNAAAMRALPHARIDGLSEEHAWVRVTGGATMGVGDRLRFVPNHACVTVATQRALVLVDGDEVVEALPVATAHPPLSAIDS